MARLADFRDVVCGQCQRTFVTRETRKLFCDPCGISRRRGNVTRSIDARRVSRPAALAEIAQTTAADKTKLVDALVDRPDYLWSVFYSVPFAPEMSKNRRWSNNGKSVVYLSDAVRRYQDMLIATTKEALRGRRVANNKVWVSLFVQKPNHRFDAINAVDTICDAIKHAVGIDDRWFCLDRVDWEIKKLDPEIYIRISQESADDALACSHCGLIAPVADFPKRSDGPFGHSRVCRSCISILQAHARKRRVRAEHAHADAGETA